MASNHNNPTSFLIPKSETKSIGYNFPSGSERTLNKLRRTKKSLIFYIEIFLNIITSTIVYGLLAIEMHYNEDIFLVVALTCVTLVPITFLVIFFIGRREAREGNTPPSP